MQSARFSKAQGNSIFKDLRSGLAAQGLLEPDGFGTVVRLLCWFPLFVCGLYYAWTVESSVWFALAVLVLSVAQGQFAFIGHDAAHGAVAAKRRGNLWGGEIGMGVIGGLCFEEWRHRHLAHHRYCQEEVRDPDMQFGTVFSLSIDAVKEKSNLGRALAPYQAFYFWPSTLLFAYSLRVMALSAALANPRRYWADLLAVTGHVALWLVLPLLLPNVSALQAITVYLATTCLLGVRLAFVFTVNHVGMPVAPAGASHFEHQVLTSRNVANPVWMDWFFGGLNYQIEHHLLPAAPRGRLREVRTSVRKAVQDAGLEHYECSWPRAVREVTAHLWDVSLAARALAAAPVVAESTGVALVAAEPELEAPPRPVKLAPEAIAAVMVVRETS